MNKQRFCPHCGERIADDPEQQYCMFCGESLNGAVPNENEDVVISSNGTSYRVVNSDVSFTENDIPKPCYKPRGWQTLAAVILFIPYFSDLIITIFFPELNSLRYGDIVIRPFMFYPLVTAIGNVILLRGAKNRATFMALAILISICLLNFAKYFIPEIPSESSWEWVNYAEWVIYFVIIPLSSVYAFSLIAQNNTFTASCRSWFNLIVLTSLIALYWSALSYIMPSNMSAYDPIPHYYIHIFTGFVMIVLNPCGWWVVVRSETFGGPYEKEVPCNYSLLNKYMLMAIVAPAILILLSLIIFNYVEVLTSL